MNKKLITKIAASAASLTLLAGAIAAPADSFLSDLTTPTISMAAFDNYHSRNLDSTGTFYIRFNNDSVVNGVSKATEAQIVGVVSSKIPQSGILTIPDKVTVSGKNYNGYSFTATNIPVTEIGASAFCNQKALKSVKFPASVKKIGFDAFRNSGLVSLSLPSTIQGIAGGAFRDCDGLYNVDFKCKQPSITVFEDCDNLRYFNSSLILNHNPKTGEPILNPGVLNELCSKKASYDTIKKCPCIQQYVTDYINYIIRTNTNESDKDVVKARKLHDWLVAHTEYDYESYYSHSMVSDGVGESWAPFFHKKSDGKFYAVCAGYAGAYKLLLNAAGIECFVIDGGPLTGDGDGHAWNIVNISGNYYHVDTTWDDGNSDPYKYFMRSDSFFNSNHSFNWSVIVNGVKKTRSTGVAPYDLRNLGDVNSDGKVNEDDSLEIQKYKLNLINFSSKQKALADMNLDGSIDLADAVFVRQIEFKMKQANYNKSAFEFVFVDGKMGI